MIQTPKRSKRPKWKIKEDLEGQLHILRKKRWITRSIIMTMLRIGIVKGGFSESPIIKAKKVYAIGRHQPNTTHGVFSLLRKYEPPLIEMSEKIPAYQENGEVKFTKNALDILNHELDIYNQLDQNDLLNDSERRDIKEFGEILHKFYGV